MKAFEIMNDIAGEDFINAEWCVDGIKAGDAEKEVKKVGVCLTASVDVIRAAAEWGADLLITHEPTFASHIDDERDTPLGKMKGKLIEESGLTIYRWHDSTHFRGSDKIGEGFLSRLGWQGKFDGQTEFILDNPKTPVEIAREIADKLQLGHPRIVGKLDGQVTKIGLYLGARGSDPYTKFRDDSLEVAIAGEVCEWYDGEPVRDLAQFGIQKTLIILGHAGSERAGMEDLADTINATYGDKGISAKYFECGELYTYAD